MARHLFIVSRHHIDLYRDLVERFQGDPNVEIIIDRRLGERRRGGMARDAERRAGERRRRQDDNLNTHSHIIVTLPADRCH